MNSEKQMDETNCISPWGSVSQYLDLMFIFSLFLF